MNMRVLLAVAVLLGAVVTSASAADWTDWRGPTQEGRTESTGLPLRWSETENITWKTMIHDWGHSTPVVLGQQIWLTSAREDGKELYALCVDLASGAVVHDLPVFTVDAPQHINPLNTYATPSATLEPGRAYVHFGSLGTAAIDTASGAVLWRRTDLNCDHMQGPASSPVIFEDLLIVHLEGTDKQFIAALDKATGKTVWQHDRPAELYTDAIQGVYKKSYQTPVIVTIDGKPQMISNGALLVTGHDPRTGAEIWRARYRDDSTISRIVTGGGFLYVNTGGSPNGTELWAIRQGGTGDVTDTHVAWKMTKDAPHESSPVLVDGLLYTVSEKSNLICTDAATGAQVWAQRMPGDYWASLLAAPGRVYLSNRKGATAIVATGREFKELAVNTLDGEFMASPAVAGNALLLRTKTHLYRVDQKQ